MVQSLEIIHMPTRSPFARWEPQEGSGLVLLLCDFWGIRVGSRCLGAVSREAPSLLRGSSIAIHGLCVGFRCLRLCLLSLGCELALLLRFGASLGLLFAFLLCDNGLGFGVVICPAGFGRGHGVRRCGNSGGRRCGNIKEGQA